MKGDAITVRNASWYIGATLSYTVLTFSVYHPLYAIASPSFVFFLSFQILDNDD